MYIFNIKNRKFRNKSFLLIDKIFIDLNPLIGYSIKI